MDKQGKEQEAIREQKENHRQNTTESIPVFEKAICMLE